MNHCNLAFHKTGLFFSNFENISSLELRPSRRQEHIISHCSYLTQYQKQTLEQALHWATVYRKNEFTESSCTLYQAQHLTNSDWTYLHIQGFNEEEPNPKSVL
jgi:hypothetical protein